MTINQELSLQSIPLRMADLIRSGIRAPRVKSMSPGTRIFRFASSSVQAHRQAAGPWWIERVAFQRIMQDAVSQRGKGFGLGWSGRRALAVRQEWSKADVLVEATIQEKIYVFCGNGAKQYREEAPNGMYITWEGWPNIEQLFIPFISDRQGLTAAGRRAIHVYRTCPVASCQLF